VELSLALPPEWTVRAYDDGRRLVTLTADALVLELGPLLPLPDEPRRWIEATMGGDLTEGQRPGGLTPVEAASELGWPMEVVSAPILGVDGEPVEQRLGAFYKFNEWVAHALVRARDQATLDQAREPLLAVLRTGRPRWQSPYVIAALADLWI
jgi:hypothetical protein